MRIISGKFRGLKLHPPLDSNTRPTSDRLKESLFSILESHKYNLNLSTSKVLDICSGTGALGIEAISRGTKLIYFIEKDAKAIHVIEKNISKLKNFFKLKFRTFYLVEIIYENQEKIVKTA